MSNGAQQALTLINVLLAAMRAARTFGIEYRMVTEMMAQAEADGRDELNTAELQSLLERSQSAIDNL